jgi:hypothetical protein
MVKKCTERAEPAGPEPAPGLFRRRFLHRVNRHDVGVIERGHRLGLALEAAAALGIGGQVAGQNLQGHVALELGVLGNEHLSHAALADPLDEAAVQQHGSGLERHEKAPPDCRVSNCRGIIDQPGEPAGIGGDSALAAA